MAPRHHLSCTFGLALAASLAVSGAAFADVGGRPFYAVLTGGAEVPGPGDPDGSGTARITINPGKSEVCWQVSVEDIGAPTAAHIHIGGPTVAGGVVVTLTAPTDGASSGCQSVDDDLAEAIFDNPGGYYVNVHTAAFPGGAVRGQLSSKKMK